MPDERDNVFWLASVTDTFFSRDQLVLRDLQALKQEGRPQKSFLVTETSTAHIYESDLKQPGKPLTNRGKLLPMSKGMEHTWNLWASRDLIWL